MCSFQDEELREAFGFSGKRYTTHISSALVFHPFDFCRCGHRFKGEKISIPRVEWDSFFRELN